MSDTTSIEWTEATWNPVTGCSKVSPGCAHCYAETFAERWRGIPGHHFEQGFDLRLWPERLDMPLRWRKPRMVFVNSMSDLFHEQVPFEFVAAVFGVMAAAPRHVFQVLTKRPERLLAFCQWVEQETRRGSWRTRAWQVNEDAARELLPDISAAGTGAPWPLPNVWLGVSIENRRFVPRADVLREIPAAVRFISAEPLLGPLVMDDEAEWAGGFRFGERWSDGYDGPELDLNGIDWLICGGESGPGHRPMDPGWARDLRDACDQSGSAFFLKQLGGARPGTRLEDLPEDLRIREFPCRAPAPRGQLLDTLTEARP